MSWGTCYKASNNIHAGYPALMSEGNLYTDWNSACKINNKIKRETGLKSNYAYRQWLINNANNVMNKNTMAACADCCGCMENFKPVPPSNKYLFTSCTDKIIAGGDIIIYLGDSIVSPIEDRAIICNS